MGHHYVPMATVQPSRIQYSQCVVLLVFLLQFSSLQLPSLGYDIQDKYFINCGSDTSVRESGKVYAGESALKTNFDSSYTASNQSAVSSPLYQTARIFGKESWYKFNTEPNGTYLVRLHFFPFPPPSNLSSATFNVSVPGFWLLQNFNATNATNNNSALVKEFYIQITSPGLRITFRPLPSSFAFVNAIELFLLPLHLIVDQVARFTYGISTPKLSTYNGLYSRVLETKHRLNVGGQTTNDSLLRKWIPDDTYLAYPENAHNSSPYNDIKYRAKVDSDGPNANLFTAPTDVYGTAKVTKNMSTNASDVEYKLSNITWSLPVEKNTDHFLRLHFCDFFSLQTDLTVFNLSIYDAHVMAVNEDGSVPSVLPTPYYYDFVVHSDDSGFMRVGVTPSASGYIHFAFLNGLEIMRVIESSTSVPPDPVDSNSKHKLLVVLGSVVGGLVLVVVVVALGFLWHLKLSKEKPFENSNWLPVLVTAGGSSHNRLTDLTSQGSPLPNINLGLRIPLIELQSATKNFHASQIIGKGSFGNVYKGVLRNGMIVAVKRSQPGSGDSGQGLLEFQTEIMVLSKIHHKHLVSLIGYCDERFEMILVYEYMEKGTLRDHLYNTTFPSLSGEQRIAICVGAAKGLHYLHKGAVGGIIHRDVKSTNILLDENHVAKVSDFGISRTGPLEHQSHVSTTVKGTLGYLDPEYLRRRKLTEKSDVYSFGIVLLEVLCARPVIDSSLPREQRNLAEWGLLCKNKGILEGIIDPSIKDQIDQNSLRKFSETVEKCLQEDGTDRPTMGDVLWDLEYALLLQRGVHGSSYSSVSTSLQLSNVRRLPSFSTPSEVDDSSKVLNPAA
ncbi:hypothetical protein Fmac_014702 [Flemingia macrophylla]|uniref:Protein kinase domain-containing protein n=1 Tax=Flemingia macrophylla TaxID=520843 RepID=A0ABD1MCG3_9FABA